MKSALAVLLLVFSLFHSDSVFAEQNIELRAGLQHLPTRDHVTVALFYQRHPQAIGTILILPGGAGGFGKIVDGQPDGRNFLVRSHDYFFAAGFNVAIMGRPSDIPDLDYRDRISSQHMEDIAKTINYLTTDNKLPV
jgi:hypothetical protein